MASGARRTGDFDVFVDRQHQAAAAMSEDMDWNKERDEWLRYLDFLYESIEGFLKSYIDAKKIGCHYQEIELNEDDIGSYKARKLILRIGRQEITLTPVGTLLIGSKGRVDVLGPAGRTRLVLVDDHIKNPRSFFHVTMHPVGRKSVSPPAPPPAKLPINWVWKILSSPPEVKLIELTRQSLFDMIMEVTNG